jgi:hypothetical protein
MNMKGTVECTRCHAQMESGWVADYTHGGIQRENWSPGEPQPSAWTGLKVEKDHVIPITTLRCPKCGYLESYAMLQSQNGLSASGRSSSQRQLAAVLIGLVAILIALGVALLVRAK